MQCACLNEGQSLIRQSPAPDSGSARDPDQLPSDSNCQSASLYTKPSDLSFIPTDPAVAAAASARVTVPTTIGSPEVGSSTRRTISSVSCSVANNREIV